MTKSLSIKTTDIFPIKKYKKKNAFIPEKLDNIPDGLWERIILPCLNKDPQNRPTAEEITQIFEDDLDNLIDDIDFNLFEQYQEYIETEEAKIEG